MPFGKKFSRPILSGHPLRDDQVYTAHGFANWCKDSSANSMNGGDIVMMVHEYFGYETNEKGSFTMLHNMANPDYWMAKMVAERLMDPRQRRFFEHRVHEVHAYFTRRHRLRNPAPNYADVTGK